MNPIPTGYSLSPKPARAKRGKGRYAANMRCADMPFVADVFVNELTPRERQTLILVASGLTNQNIAERMRVKRTSADAYVRRALEKLGFANRVQATLYILAKGMVGLDEAYATMKDLLSAEQVTA